MSKALVFTTAFYYNCIEDADNRCETVTLNELIRLLKDKKEQYGGDIPCYTAMLQHYGTDLISPIGMNCAVECITENDDCVWLLDDESEFEREEYET